jgi:hypothetical protein
MPNTAFKVFLSHSYRSAAVNRYFFDTLSDVAELQFEVDEGTTATNVTRLERLVRASDAFVGIYPYDREEPATPEALRKASRYFRLELDLAIRSGKPAIVFCDQRYGPLLRVPSPTRTVTFDDQEVTGGGAVPSADKHRKAFADFCDVVRAWRTYETTRVGPGASKVALLLPPPDGDHGYTAARRDIVRQMLDRHGYEDVEEMVWPPRLDRATRKLLDGVDWMIADVAGDGEGAAMVAYLHGRFIPMLRLAHGGDDRSALERALFGAFEVGYVKDIVRWQDAEQLSVGLTTRLADLGSGVVLIKTLAEAREYFDRNAHRIPEADKRAEGIFLSYAGEDAEIAAPISAALQRRFKHVFDYKDGQSLKAGEAWLPAIFDKLSKSAVGVPLLSPAYFESGNCKHEAEHMVALRDQGKMRVIPIKIHSDMDGLPSFLKSIQYANHQKFPDAEALGQHILELLDAPEG